MKMTSSSMNDLPVVEVKQLKDGTYVLEYDETNPLFEKIKDWTQEDWNNAIREGLARF